MKKLLVFTALVLLFTISFSTSRAEENEESDTFTVVWLSDTQDMAYGGYDHALQKMGNWIVEQKDALNIRYIVQTGDAVDNGASEWQWAAFDEMYMQFRGRIPYISAAGNHEVKKNGYLEYLMRDQVRNIPPENAFLNGESAFGTFEANREKFVILAIGFGVEEASVGWANDVLQTHKDHTAILLFHDYMQDRGRFSINGESMFRQLVEPNPNVRLVLCGHVSGVSSRIDEIDDNKDGVPDRKVTQMMYNYQQWREKCGQLRTMEFNMKDHTITITTYSPVTKQYYRDYMFGDHYTFTLENAFGFQQGFDQAERLTKHPPAARYAHLYNLE